MKTNINILDSLSDILKLPKSDLENTISSASRSYRKYFIPKKNGSRRLILHPSSQLKSLQYAFMYKYLNDYKVHEIAFGYRSGLKSPLLKNAELHSQYKYSVRIDFEDFFPSINYKDLEYYLQKRYTIDWNNEKIIKNIVFPDPKLTSGLAVGSPISPICSNIVMYELDQTILSIAKSLDGSVSRYADDIIFSANDNNLCKSFVNKISLAVKANKIPTLCINKKKTLFMPINNKRMITGLIITPEGRVTVGKEKKELIKRMIYKSKYHALDTAELDKLIGNLAFVLDVEPTFYTFLVTKYGNHVNSLLHRQI